MYSPYEALHTPLYSLERGLINTYITVYTVPANSKMPREEQVRKLRRECAASGGQGLSETKALGFRVLRLGLGQNPLKMSEGQLFCYILWVPGRSSRFWALKLHFRVFGDVWLSAWSGHTVEQSVPSRVFIRTTEEGGFTSYCRCSQLSD